MKKQFGMVIFILMCGFLLLVNAQSTKEGVIFAPNIVAGGDIFTAQLISKRPIEKLIFNPEMQPPAKFSLIPKPENRDGVYTFTLPKDVLGGNPIVDAMIKEGSTSKTVNLRPIQQNAEQYIGTITILGQDVVKNQTTLVWHSANITGTNAKPILEDSKAIGSLTDATPICKGKLEIREKTPYSSTIVSELNTWAVKNRYAAVADVYKAVIADPVPNYGAPAYSFDDALAVADFRQSVKLGNSISILNTPKIAIVDTGVSNFSDTQRVKDPYNFIANTTNASDDFMKDFDFKGSSGNSSKLEMKGHGSIVAEIAAGQNGISPNSTIIPVKVCDKNGSCRLDHVIRGVCYAIAKVGAGGIVNMSFGGDTDSNILTAIINEAVAKGVKFVASAGNREAYYKAKGILGVLMQFPAATQVRNPNEIVLNNLRLSPSVFGVGAVGNYNNVWIPTEFSQRGAYVDIVAPGAGIVFNNSRYAGTSFAAPFIAGALALAAGKQMEGDLKDICDPSFKIDRNKHSPIVGCGMLNLSSIK